MRLQLGRACMPWRGLAVWPTLRQLQGASYTVSLCCIYFNSRCTVSVVEGQIYVAIVMHYWTDPALFDTATWVQVFSGLPLESTCVPGLSMGCDQQWAVAVL